MLMLVTSVQVGLLAATFRVHVRDFSCACSCARFLCRRDENFIQISNLRQYWTWRAVTVLRDWMNGRVNLSSIKKNIFWHATVSINVGYRRYFYAYCGCEWIGVGHRKIYELRRNYIFFIYQCGWLIKNNEFDILCLLYRVPRKSIKMRVFRPYFAGSSTGKVMLKAGTFCVRFLTSLDIRQLYSRYINIRRYTQREFKLKFSALLKAYDGKYT